MNETEPGLNELGNPDQRAIANPYPIFVKPRDTSPVYHGDKLGIWASTGLRRHQCHLT